MNKTISITLNGLVFNIEEDGYTRLSGYLDGLKAHFGSAAYGKEVVNDIESRIGEQFAGKMQAGKKEVVTLAEVEEVIKTMGTVEDLTGEDQADGPQPARGTKRLYRNTDDVIIAGVSSGMANYLGIDPLIPRLLFVIFTITGGWGILLYLLLWLIIPPARSAAQKLEMKGTPVNIANLEETRKRPGQEKFSVIRYFFREVFFLIGRFFRMLGPVITTLVGLLLTGVAFVAVFAISLVAIILAFNPDTAYIDPVIREVFNGSEYFMIVSSAFLALIIPALVGLILGVSLVRRRNLFSMPLIASMGVVWLASGLVLGFTTTRAAPQIEAAVRSIEERPEMSQEFLVTGFTGLVSGSDQKVKVTYGPEPKVIAYGRQRELDNTTVEVNDGKLVLGYREDFRICLICISRPLSFEVITPNLSLIEASNSSNVEVRGFSPVEKFEIVASNSARVNLEGRVQDMSVRMHNSARVTLTGTGQTLRAELTNASRLLASEFQAETVTVRASNAANAEVFASGKIDAIATNAGHIHYTGNPTTKVVDESNAGRVTEGE